MNRRWSDFGQRFQNESPFMHCGMRYDQILRTENAVAVQQDIEIRFPFSPSTSGNPPRPLLETFENIEEKERRQAGSAGDYTIEKHRLIQHAFRRSQI